MKDNPFHLSGKSILLHAPLSAIATSLIDQLTALGADVALVGPEVMKGERFAEDIANQRHIDSHRGQLHLVEVDAEAEPAMEVVGRAASALGGIDAFIDAHVSQNHRAASEIGRILEEAFERRRRGRAIFLLPELFTDASAERHSLRFSVELMARRLGKSDSTANCVVVGLTEEFLLSTFPNSSVNESAKKFREEHPRAKLADTAQIAKLVAFLVSPLGSGVSGQTLFVDRH